MRNNIPSTHYALNYHSYREFSSLRALTPYFEMLRSENSGLWFQTFLSSTNQKKITAETLISLLSTLQSAKLLQGNISILDVGCGEGELSTQLLKAWGQDYSHIHYWGIDNDPKFVEMSKKELGSIGISNNIIEGSCFNGGLSLLPDNMDIIPASHIAYYAPNTEAFVSSLLSKMARNGIMITIHESSSSYPNSLRLKYGANVNTQTAQRIYSYLKASGVSFFEYEITSQIRMPDDLENSIRSLEKLLQENTGKLSPSIQSDHELYNLKILLEFVVQTPLELLHYQGTLHEYMDDVLSIALRNNNTIPSISSLILVVPQHVQKAILLS